MKSEIPIHTKLLKKGRTQLQACSESAMQNVNAMGLWIVCTIKITKIS